MSVEKRQQAISDCETEITELEAREVSTPEEVEARTVSYTHLTLPTILLV